MGKPELHKKNSKKQRKTMEQDLRGLKIKQTRQNESSSEEQNYEANDLEDIIKLDPRKLEKVQTNLQRELTQQNTNIKPIKQNTANTFVVDDAEDADQLVNLFENVDVLTNDDAILIDKIKSSDKQEDLLLQISQIYKQLAPILRQYRSGILPKLLKWVPASHLWFTILEFTNYETWSPQSTYAITRLFISSLPEDQAYIYISKILVPACIVDIKKNQKLNIHYFNALIKSKFKCFAFFRAVVLFAAEQHVNVTFTKVVNAVIQKISLQRSVVVPGLITLLKIQPNNQLFAIIANIISKNYALPDALLEDILAFYQKTSGQQQPLVWHEGLLRLARIYGNVMSSKQQVLLYQIVKSNKHNGGISEEIVRIIKQLNQSNNQGLRVVGANDIVI